MQPGLGASVDATGRVAFQCIVVSDIDIMDILPLVFTREHVCPAVVGQHDIEGVAGNIIDSKYRCCHQVNVCGMGIVTHHGFGAVR